MKRDPGFYDYLPWDRRPVIRWPNGARVAFWVAPNIEFYELDPPRNPSRAAWARPAPDVLNYAYRDYGNRAGFWRMLETMKRCNMRGSVSLNVAMCEHHPEVIAACAEACVEKSRFPAVPAEPAAIPVPGAVVATVPPLREATTRSPEVASTEALKFDENPELAFRASATSWALP